MNRKVILLLITFFSFSVLASAQEPFLQASWRVLENQSITPLKQSGEFQVSGSGIVRFEANVTPYTSCGKAGHQYFIFQYRAKSSSEWVNGASGFKEHKGVVYSPEKWVEGKRLAWTWQWGIVPQAAEYKYRILLNPVSCWTGVAMYVPEQTLNISATLVSQGGGGHNAQRITWATQADGHRGSNGQRFTYLCPAGTISSRLWGTDLYTDDSSICTAAVHAGLISARSGGMVTIEMRAGATSYRGTTRNGVTSAAYGAWKGSFVVVGGNTEGGNIDSIAATAINWGTQADGWRGQNGRRYYLRCPAGAISSRLWGTDYYTDDSSICTAAVHAGLIGTSGGVVTIEIRGGANSYQSTTRHGVTSKGYGNWHGSFVFVR